MLPLDPSCSLEKFCLPVDHRNHPRPTVHCIGLLFLAFWSFENRTHTMLSIIVCWFQSVYQSVDDSALGRLTNLLFDYSSLTRAAMFSSYKSCGYLLITELLPGFRVNLLMAVLLEGRLSLLFDYSSLTSYV